MAGRSFLFVHSPLVGPSSLTGLAEAAASTGHEVALPDLTSMASAENPHEEYQRLAVEAAAKLTSAPILVGHSGAGAFLPSIGKSLGQIPGLVFVDAIVPPEEAPHSTPQPMGELLDDQTVDGVLRPWLDWWPAEVVDHLLPDHADRDHLTADMPRLPRSFYEVDVDVPAGWSALPCAYLCLSPAYHAERNDATRRNWPTAELDSTHLGTHTQPEQVWRALLGLVEQLYPLT